MIHYTGSEFFGSYTQFVVGGFRLFTLKRTRKVAEGREWMNAIIFLTEPLIKIQLTDSASFQCLSSVKLLYSGPLSESFPPISTAAASLLKKTLNCQDVFFVLHDTPNI